MSDSVIKILEAVALAVSTGLGTYVASHDWAAAIAAACAMFAGKLAPAQVLKS